MSPLNQSTVDTMLARSAPGPSDRERRGAKRHAFTCEQLIAEYDGQELPSIANFRTTPCMDLSANGFAYLTPEEPACEELVVLLTSNGNNIAVVARIANRRSSDEGFIVGCEFVRRLALS